MLRGVYSLTARIQFNRPTLSLSVTAGLVLRSDVIPHHSVLFPFHFMSRETQGMKN
jgi:hypothetical protein